MSAFVELVESHGAAVLAGATVLLAVGALGGVAAHGPIHRQRIGELTVLGVLIWLALACVPLRRPGMDWLRRGVGRSSGPVAGGGLADLTVPGDALPPGPASLERGEIGVDAELWLALAASLGDSVEDETWAARGEHGEEMAWVTSADAGAHGLAKPSRAGATGWKRHAARGYLLGAGAALVWLQVGWVLVWRIVRSGAAPRQWLEELYSSLPFARGRRRPRLLVSRRCRHAFSCGIWRPTVVLPAEGCRPRRREQVRHVLLHELGHAAQRDAWGNFVLNVAFPVLWVHPLYWWVRRQVRVARELIADDWAAQQSTKESYAEELLGLVKARGRFGLSYLSVMGMSARRSQFYRRMEMLLKREGQLSTRCSGVWRWLLVPAWALVVAVMVAGVGAERSSAQEVETNAKVEQGGEVERESDEDERAAESGEEKELKTSLAELREEREALRAELDELRKVAVKLQAELEASRKEHSEVKRRELKTEATRKGTYYLRADDEAKYRAEAKKQTDDAKEAAASAARRQLFENALRARAEQQRNTAALQEEAARDTAEAARGGIKRYQDLQRQNGEPYRDLSEFYRQTQNEPGRRNAYFQRAFEAQTRVGAALGQARGGSQGDLDALIRLATQYVTAQSEIPGAESRLRKMQAANEQVPNVFAPTEVDAAAIALETAHRKVELFRKIAEAVSEAGKVELSLASKAVEEGDLSDAERLAAQSRMAQGEARLKILGLILE